jgi:hypothetical protein
MASRFLVSGAIAAIVLLLISGARVAAQPFPFDQELLLDAEPIRPGKRMPILMIEPNGNAKIDLWCRSVPARVEISGDGIKIEAGALPEDLPAMQGAGQCTPERIQADEQILSALSQVTTWRWQDGAIVLAGPTMLKFRSATN